MEMRVRAAALFLLTTSCASAPGAPGRFGGGGGGRERHELPVEPWLEGRVRQDLTVAPGSPVVRVEIDPESDYPDVARENNVWTGGAGAR